MQRTIRDRLSIANQQIKTYEQILTLRDTIPEEVIVPTSIPDKKKRSFSLFSVRSAPDPLPAEVKFLLTDDAFIESTTTDPKLLLKLIADCKQEAANSGYELNIDTVPFASFKNWEKAEQKAKLNKLLDAIYNVDVKLIAKPRSFVSKFISFFTANRIKDKLRAKFRQQVTDTFTGLKTQLLGNYNHDRDALTGNLQELSSAIHPDIKAELTLAEYKNAVGVGCQFDKMRLQEIKDNASVEILKKNDDFAMLPKFSYRSVTDDHENLLHVIVNIRDAKSLNEIYDQLLPTDNIAHPSRSNMSHADFIALLNQRNAEGKTPLHLAIEANNYLLVQAILVKIPFDELATILALKDRQQNSILKSLLNNPEITLRFSNYKKIMDAVTIDALAEANVTIYNVLQHSLSSLNRLYYPQMSEEEQSSMKLEIEDFFQSIETMFMEQKISIEQLTDLFSATDMQHNTLLQAAVLQNNVLLISRILKFIKETLPREYDRLIGMALITAMQHGNFAMITHILRHAYANDDDIYKATPLDRFNQIDIGGVTLLGYIIDNNLHQGLDALIKQSLAEEAFDDVIQLIETVIAKGKLELILNFASGEDILSLTLKEIDTIEDAKEKERLTTLIKTHISSAMQLAYDSHNMEQIRQLMSLCNETSINMFDLKFINTIISSPEYVRSNLVAQVTTLPGNGHLESLTILRTVHELIEERQKIILKKSEDARNYAQLFADAQTSFSLNPLRVAIHAGKEDILFALCKNAHDRYEEIFTKLLTQTNGHENILSLAATKSSNMLGVLLSFIDKLPNDKQNAILTQLISLDPPHNPIFALIKEGNQTNLNALLVFINKVARVCKNVNIVLQTLSVDEELNNNLHDAIKHKSDAVASIVTFYMAAPYPEIISKLLAPNKDGDSPLVLAIKNGNMSGLQAMLTAFSSRLQTKDVAYKQELIELFFAKNNHGNGLLHYVAQYGNEAMFNEVNQFINAHATGKIKSDLLAPNKDGLTPADLYVLRAAQQGGVLKRATGIAAELLGRDTDNLLDKFIEQERAVLGDVKSARVNETRRHTLLHLVANSSNTSLVRNLLNSLRKRLAPEQFIAMVNQEGVLPQACITPEMRDALSQGGKDIFKSRSVFNLAQKLDNTSGVMQVLLENGVEYRAELKKTNRSLVAAKEFIRDKLASGDYDEVSVDKEVKEHKKAYRSLKPVSHKDRQQRLMDKAREEVINAIEPKKAALIESCRKNEPCNILMFIDEVNAEFAKLKPETQDVAATVKELGTKVMSGLSSAVGFLSKALYAPSSDEAVIPMIPKASSSIPLNHECITYLNKLIAQLETSPIRGAKSLSRRLFIAMKVDSSPPAPTRERHIK